MSKNKVSNKQGRDTRSQATKIVKSLNLAGDDKAQTHQITKGVQRGIEAYLRQQSERSRELDKKTKQLKKHVQMAAAQHDQPAPANDNKKPMLPWVLLAASWVIFTAVTFTLLKV